MKLVFSPFARKDLSDLAEYIARDNRDRAMSFVLEIEAKCRILTDTPFAWPEYHRRQDVRRMVFGRYLVFYRVGTDKIIVLRIVAGDRNLNKLRFR